MIKNIDNTLIGKTPIYFTANEFKIGQVAGEGITSIAVDDQLINILDYLRFKLNSGIRINSCGRTPKYNKQIGGVDGSYHLITAERPVMACDTAPISTPLRDYKALILREVNILKALGLKGVGFYDTFVHLDTGGKRVHSWGTTSAESAIIANTPVANQAFIDGLVGTYEQIKSIFA